MAVFGAIVLVAALLFQVRYIEAAQWEKLKKCSDLSFCRRHRDHAIPPNRQYVVLPQSVRIERHDKGVNSLQGNLRLTSATEPELMFSIRAINPATFHVSIVALKPERHQRYHVKDVILDSVEYLPLRVSYFRKYTDYALLTVQGNTVKISFNPFHVQLFDSQNFDSSNSPPLININHNNLLRYEILGEKPTPVPQSPSPSPSPPDSESTKNEDTDTDTENVESNTENDVPSPQEPEGWGESFQSHHDSQARGPESVGVDIAFPFADAVHGLPERTVSLSIPPTKQANGTVLSEPYRLYNLDVFEFELEKPLGLYGAVPFLIGRKGGKTAGVLWLNAAETYVDLAAAGSSGIHSHWFSETGTINMFLMAGPAPSDVFHQYRLLTGAPAMPQRFSLGYHQCRWNYRDDADARAVDAGLEHHGIPYDVLWLDIEHTDGKRYFTWDYKAFPDPSKLQNDLAVRGHKMVTIIDPHTKRDKKYPLHKLATHNNYYVMNEDGKKPFDGWCWPGSSSYLDFLSPVVRQFWAGRFNPTDYPHFTKNLYTWIDMNEPSVFNGPEGTMQKNLLHTGNVEHRHVHNQYGFYNQRATFEGLLQGHGGNDRPFVLSRSFFAGSQRYGTIWTGDNTASWEHLKSTVYMLLPLQITGMVFSGADVGGFFGDVDAELLTRWYQVGAFQPFFRAHGHLDTKRREPWLFGEETTNRISNAIRTRYNFIPLWYTLFAGNALANTLPFDKDTTGPPMRPLWWDFSSDPEVEKNESTITYSWMVGSALLVSPVMEKGITSKKVYLPGKDQVWYDLFDPVEPRRAIVGGQYITVATPMERMLVYQRGGSIVAKQNRRRRSSEAMARDPYTLEIALDSQGAAAGELYIDDGKSYDHQQGAYTLMKFKYTPKDGLEGSVSSDGTKEFLGRNNKIERIVIMRHNTANNNNNKEEKIGQAQVYYQNNNNDQVTGTAQFERLDNTIIIRKPNVELSTSWRIKITE